MGFLLFADTETTGFVDYNLPAQHHTQPRMASIGLILCRDDTLSVLGTYFSYVFNGVPGEDGHWSMPQGDGSAGAANGITDALLQEVGMPIANVMGVVEDFLSLGVTLVTHNVEFDHKVIRGELRRLGMDDYYKQTPKFCTQSSNMAELALPNPKPSSRYKYKTPSLLETYKHYFGEEPKGQHNAFADTLHVKRIYAEMKKRNMDLTPRMPKTEGAATTAPRPTKEGASGKPPVASNPQPASLASGVPAGGPTEDKLF